MSTRVRHFFLPAAALILYSAGTALAQAPVAPGSGFAGGGTPTFSGGAPIAPGSGFAPSTAGTLDAGPRVTGSTSPVARPGYGDIIADEDVGVAQRRQHARKGRSRRGYAPSYPGVPDIMEPAE